MSEIARPGSDDSRSPALARVFEYHERTKHQLSKYAAGPETLDWDAQPAPFRRYVGAEAVSLPRLADAAGPLQHALTRSPGEPLEPEPLPFALASLGALFALSLGITAWKRQGPDRWAVRANPSSGNLHPVEAYLLVSGAGFLASGVYHYRAEDHALERRARWERELEPARPALWIALTSVMWREAWKYGERAFRYCQLDTGHATAALGYAAGILGWRLREEPAIGALGLGQALGLDRAGDLGRARRTDTELEEPELLLRLEPGVAEWPLLGLELGRLSASARFEGQASVIDPHPMYAWPVVQEVAAATRPPEASPGVAPVELEPRMGLRSSSARASVASLLLGRRSAQRFDRDFVLPRASFVELLRGVAAAAACPARLDLALFVHRVEGLAPGVYLFPLASGAPTSSLRRRLGRQFQVRQLGELEELGALWELATLGPRELARSARTLHCHQDIASSSCFALGMLADLEQVLREPADYRKLLREAGSLGQSLYLQAEAVGVRGTGIGCFFDDAVAEFLTLTDTPVRSVYHFAVGKPQEDPRIETETWASGGAALSK